MWLQVLRGACSDVGRAGNFNDVCYQPKTWLTDDGEEVTGTLGAIFLTLAHVLLTLAHSCSLLLTLAHVCLSFTLFCSRVAHVLLHC